MKGYDAFFEAVGVLNNRTKHLLLAQFTREQLKERIVRLTGTVHIEFSRISIFIDQMLAIKQNSSLVERGMNFRVNSFTLRLIYTTRHSTTCLVCNGICHRNCRIHNDGNIKWCSAMERVFPLVAEQMRFGAGADGGLCRPGFTLGHLGHMAQGPRLFVL
jgi:hypothetical protein